MPTNPFFSGRIPQSLYDAIESHRHQTGESKTEVLVRALSAYTNHPVELTPVSSKTQNQENARLEELEKRVGEIDKQLDRLYGDMGKILALNSKTPLKDSLEHQMVIEGIESTEQNKSEDKATHKQEADNIPDNKSDNESVEAKKDKSPVLAEGASIGRFTSIDIPALVGATSSSAAKKVNIALSNAKKKANQTATFGAYRCVFAGVSDERSPKNGKQLMLWDVYKD